MSLILVFLVGMISAEPIARWMGEMIDPQQSKNGLSLKATDQDIFDEPWEKTKPRVELSRSTYDKMGLFISLYLLSHTIESATEDMRTSCHGSLSNQEHNTLKQQERAQAIKELKEKQEEMRRVFGPEYLTELKQYISFVESDKTICREGGFNKTLYYREGRSFLDHLRADIDKQKVMESYRKGPSSDQKEGKE